MSKLFEDVILRKEIAASDYETRKAREEKVLQLFGDYCQKHYNDLNELFEYIKLDNEKWSSGSGFNFGLRVCQNKEEKDNSNYYCVRVCLNELYVGESKTGGRSKNFEFDYNMNKVQLTKIIKNALRFLVRLGYKLPKND